MGGEKVYTLIIKMDLGCCRCRQTIDKYLCCIQRKEKITKIDYDVPNDKVNASGPFDAEKLKRHLLCKFPKIIQGIDVVPPKEEKPKDELKEKFMKQCEEEYAEIKQCIEKCKKECEEKCLAKFKCVCKGECKNKCKCECKCKCKCEEKCKCKEKCDCSCHCKEKTKEPEKPPPPPQKPPCPWPPQFAAVCCARPCVCLVPWSNNFQCCSCGVLSWPGSCGPGWGTGPSHGGRPQQSVCEPSRPRPQQWVCEPSRPKWNCEPGGPPNIILESQPNCSIM